MPGFTPTFLQNRLTDLGWSHVQPPINHFLDAKVSEIHSNKQALDLAIPFYSSMVKAGFPSPAEDYAESALDLNQYLIKHPSATFFVRASGNSMIGAGIFDKDLLIVDRSLEPVSGKVVIAAVNGELTVKRFQKTSNGGLLISANPDYPPIRLSDSDNVHIWGVVIHVVHSP